MKGYTLTTQSCHGNYYTFNSLREKVFSGFWSGILVKIFSAIPAGGGRESWREGERGERGGREGKGGTEGRRDIRKWKEERVRRKSGRKKEVRSRGTGGDHTTAYILSHTSTHHS